MIDLSHSVFDFGTIADRYDRWYDTPAGRAHDRWQKALVREVLPLSGPGELLLDVGCGTGHWSAFFASMGFEVDGVDVSREMVKIARSKGIARCRFHVGDVYHLPFRSDSFDIVTAMVVLEFVKDPKRALVEIVRCIKPGGSIIVGALDRLDPLNQQRIARGKEPYASAHMFSAKELGELLCGYGSVQVQVSSKRAEGSKRDIFGLIWRQVVSCCGASRGGFLVALVRT